MPDPKNRIKENSKKTFQMQRNTADQIWVALLEDAREELKEETKNLTIDEKEKLGVPIDVGASEEDCNGLFDDMTQMLENGFANRQTGLYNMQYLAYAYAKIADELGKEAKKIEDGIPAEDDKRQIKSMYLMENGNGPAMRMARSFKKLKTRLDDVLGRFKNQGSVYQEEFEKTLDSIKGYLSPEEQKGFVLMDKLMKGKVSDPADEKKIENWIADKGEGQAADMAKKNTKVSYHGFTKLLTSKTRVYTSVSPGVDEFLERKREEKTDYLSAVIEELESTGGGKNWDKVVGVHWNNSKAYEKMLSSIKSYQKALKEHSAGYATAYRQNMVLNCLEYIQGKEKVRTHDFGKKRFDAVMTILYKQLDPDSGDFENLLDIINTKRKVKRGDEDYLDVEKYEEKLKSYQDRGKEIVQQETEKYVTNLSDEYKTRIHAADAVYAIKPEFLPQFYKLDEKTKKPTVICFTQEQFGKLTPYDDLNLKAIGGQGQLSNKDFAAIAFFGALLPGAYKAAGTIPDFEGNPISDQDGAECFGTMHTYDLIQANNPRALIGMKVGGMQYGREKAKEAMEAYATGDKKPLAKLLAYGLKFMVNEDKQADTLGANLVLRGEMAGRMLAMLDRDPKLLELMQAGENGMTKEDLLYVRSMIKAAQIYNSAEQAREKLETVIKEGRSLSNAEKEKMMTDLLVSVKLETAFRINANKATDNPECLEKMRVGADNQQKRSEAYQKLREENKISQEVYETLKQMDGDINAHNTMKMIAEYKKPLPLYEKLYRGQTVDELKDFAKEKIKGLDLSKIRPDQMKKAAEDLVAGKPIAAQRRRAVPQGPAMQN
ncbi:MAG: hypothetical protein K6E75_13045 [Lachnospiraceae bacterium]|nr:hypothetical protein [Lachnospiraceae bacterium]